MRYFKVIEISEEEYYEKVDDDKEFTECFGQNETLINGDMYVAIQSDEEWLSIELDSFDLE